MLVLRSAWGMMMNRDSRRKPVFRYAILSDTHIRPEGESSSPWKVNLLTNDRARWVVDRINRAEPDLVIHTGDIVHPLPHLPTYGPAAEAALDILGGLEAPCYLLPGNHDVGDKNNPTVPAYIVDEHGLELYGEWFGPLHRSFDHWGVHFVLINALALNSGLPHESEHREWLEADLEENAGKRIHVFSHYPPYVLEPGETSNYDNVDEPARGWLLGLLERHGVEVFFAGHVHQFIYGRHGATDCYNLFSTCFVRQDYAEMFRVEAADDHGRNDAEKLGWCVVDVYEDGHVVRMMRSHGRTLGKGAASDPDSLRVNTCHVKDGLRSFLGVHLRHPWAELVELPYNGPIDEFVRKRVRNDYTLLGLWESGIRDLRVPLGDLMEPRIRERMIAAVGMEHRFNLFNVGVPTKTAFKALREHIGLVNAVEIVLPWNDTAAVVDGLKEFRGEVSAPVFLGNIESSVHRGSEGPKFSHYVGYGFRIQDTGGIEWFLDLEGASDAVDGFVFQVGANESPLDAIRAIDAYSKTKGFRAVVNVRLASEDPAVYLTDDLWVANRVAESVVAAASAPGVGVFADTFMDLDRGYFPRVGLYDRHLNRRMGGYVLAHLQGVLNDYGPEVNVLGRREAPGGDVVTFESSKATFELFLPSSVKPDVSVPVIGTGSGGWSETLMVDLVSGVVSPVSLKGDNGLVLGDEDWTGVPLLFIFER